MTGSDRAETLVWRVSDGTRLAAFPEHHVTEQSVDMTAEGLIAYVRHDKSVQIARVAEGVAVPVKTLTGYRDLVLAVQLSPDGRWLATGTNDGELRLWRVDDLDTPLIIRGHRLAVRRVVFDARSETVATVGSDQIVKIWDVASGKHLATLEGHTAPVRVAAFSADGRILATASVDGEVILWDTQRASGRTSVRSDSSVRALEFSRDSAVVVGVGYETFATVWDLAGAPARTLAHDGRVWAARFSPDGQRIVTAGWDGTAAIWRRDGTREHTLAGHTEPVLTASFDHTGARVVTAGEDGTARIWDVATGQPIGRPLAGHGDDVVVTTFSPSDRLILTASYDGTARIWSTTSFETTATLTGHTGGILDASFDGAETRVVSVGFDGVGKLWDLRGRLARRLEGYIPPVWKTAFTPDGKTVAIIDRSVRLWDAASGRFRHQLVHEADVSAMTFSPDGVLLATGSKDGHVRVWDVATGALCAIYDFGIWKRDHERVVSAVAFSPDGTRLAASRLDGQVDFWDASRETRSLREVDALLSTMPWKLDGTALVPRPGRAAPVAPRRGITVACVAAADCYERGLAEARAHDALSLAFFERACLLGDLRGCARILMPLRILDIHPAPDGTVYVLAFVPRPDGIVVIDPQGGESQGGDVFVARLGKDGYRTRSLRGTTWTVEAGALAAGADGIVAFTSARRRSGTWANDGMLTRLDGRTLEIARHEMLYTEWNAGYGPHFEDGVLVHYSFSGHYLTRGKERSTDAARKWTWDPGYYQQYLAVLAGKLGLTLETTDGEPQIFRRFLTRRYLQ